MIGIEDMWSAVQDDLGGTSPQAGTTTFSTAPTRNLSTLESAAQTPDLADPTSPPTVLIVDDDPRNLFALESVLEGGNYAIAKAQSGREALLALMSQEFAAIVLDVQMPELSGIEIARLIKQRRRTQHIPIIFLTAHYLEEEHAVLAYDVGAVDYLTKPINPLVLRSKVNVFVDLFRKTRALATLNAKLEAQNEILEREAEERMRRIQAEAAMAEAEAANEAKDRFLAMLSHELRTPLTPILYAVSLLERDQTCPANIREALTTIRRNVGVEVRLIDDLLDLARIRSGKLTLQIESVDAHDILREAITICIGNVERRAARIVQAFRATNVRLEADPARVRQIFWNLLSNAVKFTPPEGTIYVRTKDFKDELQVEVTDTGPGIEPAKLDSVFDAFEQVLPESSAGLGLGLAICRALVELHGGSIKAESLGPGTGASFIVRLPIRSGGEMPRLAGITTAPGLGTIRVLVVDDHQDTTESLRLLLNREGHEVCVAGSVAQALELAETFEFDVLISDIGLPDGSGTHLLESLNRRKRRLMRAIAMSGFGMEQDRERSLTAGFAEHLTKPVEFADLQRAITKVARTLNAHPR
ncbi:MAG TPA: response regulator [Terrimicrobiaceae bacterium]|nr:response regulator [Terrimicrobiaceae bacterium]